MSKTHESSQEDAYEELSEKEQARIRAEVASVLEGLADKQARRELIRFDGNVQNQELGDAQREAYYAAIDRELDNLQQKVDAQRRQARQKFWKRARLSLTPLLVFFAMPDRDAPTAPPTGTGSYAERYDAEQQLSRNGITNYQRGAYNGLLSDALERGVTPYFYSENGGAEADILRALGGVIRGAVSGDDPEARTREVFGDRAASLGQSVPADQHDNIEKRHDAWRMYLGIPQRHGTFGISDYRPEHGVEDRYYYRIQNFLQEVQSVIGSIEELHGMNPVQLLLELEARQGSRVSLEDRIGAAFNIHPEQGFVPGDIFSGIMGHFTLGKGQDERGHYISYYDRWDLGESLEGVDGLVGRPYEIYDRIYYDPSTLQVL